MKYLVAANVLSEATKPDPDRRVLEWLYEHEPDIVVDPIVLGELRFGILLLPKGRKRTVLERWFDDGVQRLHCLPWEADTGLQWAAYVTERRDAPVRIDRDVLQQVSPEVLPGTRTDGEQVCRERGSDGARRHDDHLVGVAAGELVPDPARSFRGTNRALRALRLFCRQR